jgi:type IV secretory pathway VirB10-like protein
METVPQQPLAKPPIKRTLPIVLVLTAAVLLIGISTVYNAMTSAGRKKEAAKSALQTRPSTADPQQVKGFENQQALIAKNDETQANLQKAMAMLQAQEKQIPAPEADSTSPMTPQQSAAIYGGSANAPRQTSNQSEALAQAKQKAADREKKRVDALNSDTVAVDFQSHPATPTTASPATSTPSIVANQNITDVADNQEPEPKAVEKKDKDHPMAAYDFDDYEGSKLYRVFEGTVLEGVVTNHVDGGMSGPVLIMLTTDYYSHDHQQLLLPQGTRLIGQVQAVGNQQQHKLAVIFHRAVCPDGFSLDIDKYAGLDQIGTTGLATKVDHGYLQAFAAAAAIGGLGGLAQIGNSGSVLTPDSQIRNGISSQTSQESEQILNHFLNRLPIITLKEGTRARVYIGKDILIPSYAEHRVNPTL